MSRFHNYSLGNILEIARQKPDAIRVAGFWKWKELGRSVKKGEKGIRILAPIIGVRRKKDEEAQASKDPAAINKPVLVGFRSAYVFDVSQTEGAELPELREISGDVGENRDKLIAFIERHGIELVFTERIAPALGMSYGGRIAILPGQSKAEEFSTLVHELAHEMLHKAERRTATTKVVRETEAEAIAFVIDKAVGLETGTASADYIQLYHGNAFLLADFARSHPADLRCHPCRLGIVRNRDDGRCRTGEGGVMQTILQIIQKAGGWHPGLYLKIDNPPYMELVIEAMDESGPMGLPAISVCHYGEQNGDAMRDPEMCFELGLAGGAHLSAFYYRNDYAGVEQWSRNIVRGNYVHLIALHEQHQRFATTWDNNLRLQGFAEAFTDKCIRG
jgi:hypothetical protein